MFAQYFDLGYDHILHKDAIDHILFILVLCALYKIQDWKKLLMLVTAFTIGHSITLAMTALDVIKVSSAIVEFLIPITIFLTALYDLRIIVEHREKTFKVRYQYLMGLIFGFIHGMAFSSILKASLFPGEEEKLITQLLAFNIGVEAGQIILVIIFLGLSWILVDKLRLKHLYWKYSLSLIPLVYSLYLAIQNWPF